MRATTTTTTAAADASPPCLTAPPPHRLAAPPGLFLPPSPSPPVAAPLPFFVTTATSAGRRRVTPPESFPPPSPRCHAPRDDGFSSCDDVPPLVLPTRLDPSSLRTLPPSPPPRPLATALPKPICRSGAADEHRLRSRSRSVEGSGR